MLPAGVLEALRRIVGGANVIDEPARLAAYATDALGRGRPPDVVVRPGSTEEVAALARLCHEHRLPLVPRGAGTGYTGGAVPVFGGVVVSMERFDRILEIDEASLLAVVEPSVVTARLQEAVERVGLFYPPDPASLERSTIGGNVAENAGGPRAFKYGTTGQYVLGLEAVLPTGERLRVGGRTTKNVVGYDLTRLLVGSEGTLAIVTQIVLRLVPKPPARAVVRALFASIDTAADACTRLLRSAVVPAALEIVDGECLRALAAHLGPAAPGFGEAGSMLLVELDGAEALVAAEAPLVARACREAGATDVAVARTPESRDALWRARRELSPALRTLAPVKINHDIVVPRGRLAEVFALARRLAADHRLCIPCFGHAGDGNIHVNLMFDPGADPDAPARARAAERRLFEEVVRLGGSISGEHGIGFAKAPFLGLELQAETIALMRRIKAAFDPHGILNPGKIFDGGDPAGPA